jgi:hypothetical protein
MESLGMAAVNGKRRIVFHAAVAEQALYLARYFVGSIADAPPDAIPL